MTALKLTEDFAWENNLAFAHANFSVQDLFNDSLESYSEGCTSTWLKALENYTF